MNKKSKFNILHTDSFKDFGGAQTDIVMLLKFMEIYHGEKFNFYVIHNDNKRLKAELDKLGICNVSISMKNFLDIGAIFKIRNFLKKYDIDLINFHSSRDHFLSGVASFLIFRKRIAKVLTRHVAYRISFLKGFLIHLFLTDRFIVISDFIKGVMIKDVKINPKKIETIYSPRIFDNSDNIDKEISSYQSEKQDIRDELGIKFDKKIVSLIGRLSKEKGHETFVKAAGLIIKKRSDIQFVIIGEGGLRDHIAYLIKKMGLEEYFVISGFKKNIKRFIAASDLIVVPSGLEGMGSIIIEACALKKAVIASNVGGIPELIKNNETGLLFESEDYTELANKIISLADNRELIKNLGLNCYKDVIKRFNAKDIASKTISLYMSLLVRGDQT